MKMDLLNSFDRWMFIIRINSLFKLLMGKRHLALPLRSTASIYGHFSGIAAKWLHEMTLFPLFLLSLPWLPPTHPLYAVNIMNIQFFTSFPLSLLTLLHSWFLAAQSPQKFDHEIGARGVCMAEGQEKRLLIAPPDIIHLFREFVLRSRTNTPANPLPWRSDTERDIHTHTDGCTFIFSH